MEAPKYDCQTAQSTQRAQNKELHQKAIEAVREAIKWQEQQYTVPDGDIVVLKPLKPLLFLRAREDNSIAGKYHTDTYHVKRLALYAIDNGRLLDAPTDTLYVVSKEGHNMGLLTAEYLADYPFQGWRWEMVHRSAVHPEYFNNNTIQSFSFEEEQEPDGFDYHEEEEENEARYRELYG